MRRVRDHWRLALVALLGAMLALGGVAWVVRAPWRGAAPVERGTATFVGRQACASCHPEQDRLWRGSDHDLAMQVADEPSILGDFGDATFTHRGVTSRFFRRDGKFFARTEGPDGRLQDFPIAYAFGVRPLQQYLIAFPGGRYQALGIAWDTRAREVCHGPGSRHVAWAKARPATARRGDDDAVGLVVRLRDRRDAVWRMDAATGIARRAGPAPTRL